MMTCVIHCSIRALSAISDVHAQALYGVCTAHPAGDGNRQLVVGLPPGDLPVDNQVVLIAGNGQVLAKLYAGVAFTFLDQLCPGQKN